MLLRPRTEADLPAAVAVLREVHERDGYPVRWHEPAGTWLTPEETVAAWVVVDGAALLGHVVLEARDDGLHVGRLFVACDARGRGVADLLLAAVEADAQARQQPLTLEVHVTAAAAITRYERRGWTRTGTHVAGWLERDGSPARAHRYAAPAH